MKKTKLPFREVHLDFHTSELIENVGEDFNAEEFVETLKLGHVNSITCFARCHHGWLYYDSKKFPERVHPNLKNRNLLKEQIEVCHKNGIRIPVYTTVQWDNYTAQRHNDWLCKDEYGNNIKPMFTPGFYHYLCINSPYRDFLKEHIEDIFESIEEVDGIFYDIMWPQNCSCKHCREKMGKEGFNWEKPKDREQFAVHTINEFIKEMSAYVRTFNENCSIYYNSGHVVPGNRGSLPGFTHLEFDALPSGHGNYSNFPMRTRFDRTLGLDYLGMTGKFHTSWGDFHSFKTREALEYECFMLLALGGKCMIGDQLIPKGRLEKEVYKLIGSVYSQVEKKEPWCEEVKPVTEIGVMTTQEFGQEEAILGTHRILNESSYQYDIIDTLSDFSPYKLIIMPDRIPVNDELKEKLNKYLSEGGRILASFASGMDSSLNQFNLDCLGVKVKEELVCDVQGKPVRGILHYRHDYADYILPKGEIGKGLPETEHVMFTKANEVEAVSGTKVLMDVIVPGFYRNQAHYCSHMQTPSCGDIGTPAVVSTENTIYFAHNIFEIYSEYAPAWCKRIVQNAIDMLLGERILKHNGPSTLETAVNHQEKDNRYVVHLLHYVPIKRAKQFEVIEDVYPLYNIEINVKSFMDIKTIKCQPENISIDFKKVGDRIIFTVPTLKGHQMIELKY